MSVLAEQQINFFRASLAPSKDSFDLTKVLQMTLGVIIGMAVFYGWGHWKSHDLKRNRHQLDAVLAERTEQLIMTNLAISANNDARQAMQAKLARLERQRTARDQAIRLLEMKKQAHEVSISSFMYALSRKVPDGLWLTEFSIDEFREGLTIHGRSTHPELVPEFIQRLTEDTNMNGIHFRRLNIETPSEQGSYVDFALQSKSEDSTKSDMDGTS